MRVLVANAGSSSVKLSLIGERDETIAERELPAPRAGFDHQDLLAALDQGLGRADAVGHRIVHGGDRFRAATLIDANVEAALRELTALAPLHQPKSLAALAAVSKSLPDIRAVACFDTAFHADLPAEAQVYALPASWRSRWPIRRYGFHGLSHSWVARRAPELLQAAPTELRIVSCHLGAGASLCAIRGGRSLQTTMGFTPLEGLVMATRSGSVDPGLLLWLLERGEMSERELSSALEHESGLLGLTGTADMRELLDRRSAGDADASLGFDVYVSRLQAGIAAIAAAMGGLDVLVFTGGVGERSAQVREAAASQLGFLGVTIDEDRNRAVSDEGEITREGSSVRTLVLHAREDLEIAQQVRALLGT